MNINIQRQQCPRYRKKIFNIQGVENRFKELTIAECNKGAVSSLNTDKYRRAYGNLRLWRPCKTKAFVAM